MIGSTIQGLSYAISDLAYLDGAVRAYSKTKVGSLLVTISGRCLSIVIARFSAM